MKTAKPERIEFNPQIGIAGMMIGRYGREKGNPHHIAYRCGLTL